MPETLRKCKVDGRKHAKVQRFLQGKGVSRPAREVELDLSDMEIRSLRRKAKQHGFGDPIVVQTEAGPQVTPEAPEKSEAPEGSETAEEPEAEEPDPSGSGQARAPARRRRSG